jgi:hypothetical protein
MTFGRWYPSAIMLADGRVLVVSGASDGGGITPRIEIYNQLEGWELLSEDADRLLPLYPRMHVLPNGEVACLGNGQDLIFFNPDTQTWREIGDAGVTPDGDDDLAVLLGPAQAAKILHTGGGAVDDSGQELGVATAQIIDLTQDDPAWRDIAPMANPRWFPNSVLLPDGTQRMVLRNPRLQVDKRQHAHLWLLLPRTPTTSARDGSTLPGIVTSPEEPPESKMRIFIKLLDSTCAIMGICRDKAIMSNRAGRDIN